MNRNYLTYWVIIFAATLQRNVNCHDYNNCTYNTSTQCNFNFKIAVVLPILKPKRDEKGNIYGCSNELRDDALQMVEALYFAWDLAESEEYYWKEDTLSPYTTLTINVVENCGNEKTDLRHFLELLLELLPRDEITTTKQEKSPDIENDTLSDLIGIIYSNDLAQLHYETIFQSFTTFPHISLLGPPKEIFNPTELTRKFFTVTSGHIFIIDVIFEILAYHRWKYVTVIYSDIHVGKRNVRSFVKRVDDLAAKNGVCITDVMSTEMVSYYSKHPSQLRKEKPSYNTVDVIICYCDTREITELRTTLQKGGKSIGKYVVIAGSTESFEKNQDQAWEPDLGDLYYVTLQHHYVQEFRDYYTSLTMENNTRHRYLEEFRKRYFECGFDSQYSMERKCDDKNFKDTYKDDPRTVNIIKSVYFLAQLVRALLGDYSAESFILDDFLWTLASFLYSGDYILFDEKVSFTRAGFPRIEKFDVYKYQANENEVPHNFTKVAIYHKLGDEKINENNTFQIEGRLIIFNNETFQYSKDQVKPTCSEPCPPGYAKKVQRDYCCWDCYQCNLFEILNSDGTSCKQCEDDSLANQNKTECISISSILHIPNEWDHSQNLISMGFSLISIVLTIIVSYVFVKNRNTPAVKSTTKELCYVMFAGMILANVTLFISVLTRNFKTINVKVLPAIGFAMVYAALYVKTKRIARILVTSKHKFANINPKYVSLKAQIVITSILIGVEILICWTSVQIHDFIPSFEENIDDVIMNFSLKAYYLDGIFFIEIFAFVALLVLLCTYYAIVTRNLPGNFNEAKYIGFAMYATVLTGVAFGLVYFTSEKKILAINLCVSINSLTILIFLFSPKLYIILWKPERNTRTYFSPTASNIRSFIGNESQSNSLRGSLNRDHLLDNTELKVNSAADMKEQAYAELVESILDNGFHIGEKMKKKSKIEKSEDDWQKAFTEVFEKAKLCQIALNRVQKTDVK